MNADARPFIGSEALLDGRLRRHQLRSRFRAIFPDIYVRRDQPLTARDRAVAAWLWSHREGAWRAHRGRVAWLKWVDEHLPVELIWSNARPPRGVRTYDMRLRPEEFGIVESVPVTTPQRTAFDIGRRKPLQIAIARLDALMQATGVKVHDVAEIADQHRGARGLRQLETALELVDAGSQSPKRRGCGSYSSGRACRDRRPRSR